MNNQNTIRILVAILLVSLVSSPLLAQTARQSVLPERQAGARVVPEQDSQMITAVVHGRTISMARPRMLKATQANFEQFRSDLLAILNIQKETATMMHLDINDRLDSAIQQVAALQLSDIETLQQGIVDLSFLKEAVLHQKELIAPGLASRAARTAQFSPNDPFPDAEYASVCPLPIPTEVAFTSGLVVLTAGFVKALAADACNQILAVLISGGNLALLCIITDIIYFAARIIDYPIQFCYNDGTYGQIKGIFDRLEYIHNQLDYSIANDNTNKALLSTQLTNAENHVVTNDNNNKAALSSQTASFQTLAIRAAIERNMAADPATTSAVGLFQLPASRGGYLEVARQTLIDVYNAQVAAAGPGVVIYNPSSDLSLGATFTAQGKYSEAYYYYRKGYRSVVKYP
ncbi:MAG: hypothetical protein ABI977_01070 [Acidobacteriota bacterium]